MQVPCLAHSFIHSFIRSLLPCRRILCSLLVLFFSVDRLSMWVRRVVRVVVWLGLQDRGYIGVIFAGMSRCIGRMNVVAVVWAWGEIS